MPTIQRVPTTPLDDQERPGFIVWARSRPQFRACPEPIHGGCCTPFIAGKVSQGRRPQALADLVERWRSLGRPIPSAGRASPQQRPTPARTDTKGAIRGRAQATRQWGLPDTR